MSRMKNIAGWMIRGGDQTRAELADKTTAIQELQQQVAELRTLLDAQRADIERFRHEALSGIDDLSDRTSAATSRLEHVEAVSGDHDDALASLARVVGADVDADD